MNRPVWPDVLRILIFAALGLLVVVTMKGWWWHP